MKPVLVTPGEAEAITDRPDRELRLLFTHDLLTVTWFRYDAGQRGANPHVHREHTDGFYVVGGQISVRLGPEQEPLTLTAGSLALIPPGVVHAFDNDGPEEARVLNFHAPDGGFARYLRTRSEDGFDSFDPPEDGGRPASDAIVTADGSGERFVREGRTITVVGAQPQISVFTLEVDPGWPGIGAHVDAENVDSWFVLDGEMGLVHGDDVVRADAGTFYAAPPGATHGLVNDGGQAVLLNVHGPDLGHAAKVRGR